MLNHNSLCVTIPEILIIAILPFIMYFCLFKICSFSVFVVGLFTLSISPNNYFLFFYITFLHHSTSRFHSAWLIIYAVMSGKRFFMVA